MPAPFESLPRTRERSAQDWRVCPCCHTPGAVKHGFRVRRPWTLARHREVAIQRYRCRVCGAAYSEEHPDPSATLRAGLPPGRWYARSVQRCAIDQWVQIPMRGTDREPLSVSGGVAALNNRPAGALADLAPPEHPPPAEERCRHYCHPGKSALEVAGMTTEGCNYLDALEV